MEIKEVYGNGQQVSEAMMMQLEKLQTMCDKYGLRLSCYVEQHSPSLPIVLAIYDGDFALSHLTLYNEADFLLCISGQCEFVDYKCNKNYRYNTVGIETKVGRMMLPLNNGAEGQYDS